MRLLLDTHVVLALINQTPDYLPAPMADAVSDSANELFVSIASIWEIAIKHRLKKLPLRFELEELALQLGAAGINLLPVEAHQVIVETEPVPDSKDPFDRLLLGIAKVEGLELVTIDRALIDHPLAWCPAAA